MQTSEEKDLQIDKGRRILIVDDDEASCRTLQLHLHRQGFQVVFTHSVFEGLQAAKKHNPDLVILDIRMPGMSGLDGLPEFKAAFPDTHVIMITAFHDMESTIQAMQRGANDYIHKPIDIDELDSVVKKLLRPHSESDIIQSNVDDNHAYNTMVGRSYAMKEVFKTIGLVAKKPVTVLITGESGTGKELVARAIHRSGNPDGPFVAVNCAALVETLLESDMFGHEKGAFTGAVARQLGKFSLANNGTIFLDEISELSPVMQAKLLRVLQEKEYTPIGAKESQCTNARVITATNLDLAELVQQGDFREDLYYRLQVVNIHLPPLRERKEEIVDLVQALLNRINHEMNRNITQVSKDVFECMQQHDWPGNVRELENVLAKAVALCSGNTITLDLVESIYNTPKSATDMNERPLDEWNLAEIEKAHVLRVLKSTKWHKGRTCKILGISRPRLRRMIKQFDLIPPDYAIPDDSDSNEDDNGESTSL